MSAVTKRLRGNAVLARPPTMPGGRRLAIWFVILGCGAALLYARFNWSVDGGYYAKRAYVLSLYLFLITLPTVFYLARRTLHNARVATALTAVVFVVSTVPYRLLHLDTLYYYATRARISSSRSTRHRPMKASSLSTGRRPGSNSSPADISCSSRGSGCLSRCSSHSAWAACELCAGCARAPGSAWRDTCLRCSRARSR